MSYPGIIASALWLAPSAYAHAPAQRAGDAFELTLRYETAEQSSDGVRSGSRGSDAIVERVVAVRVDGVELEYDLPAQTNADERARTWQLPARVLRAPDGSLRLLNGAALEQRLAAWLARAKWDRSICGRTIFTWNAFRIDCDPQSVLATIGGYDLTATLPTAGVVYRDPDAVAPTTLVPGSAADTYIATLRPDPAKVRRTRADTDVVVGEISGTAVTLETALAKHAAEQVSGTIVVTWATDSDGTRQRSRVVTLEITRPDGVVESSTVTYTLRRKRLAASD